MNRATAAERQFYHTAGSADTSNVLLLDMVRVITPQYLILTSLSRFVDRFISLDDMDESRGLNEDFGLLAHRGALTLNSDINGSHSSGAYCRDLQYQKTHICERTGGYLEGGEGGLLNLVSGRTTSCVQLTNTFLDGTFCSFGVCLQRNICQL